MLKEVLLDYLVHLDERSADIVARRVGVFGESHTLEEVGTHYGLTRERIRQIEKKAIKVMRFAVRQREKRPLDAHADCVWRLVAGGQPWVDATSIALSDRLLKLLFNLESSTLGGWISYHTEQLLDGRLAPGMKADRVGVLVKELGALAKVRQLPTEWPGDIDSSDPPEVHAACLASGMDFKQGYLIPQRITKRQKRALRIHGLIVGHGVVDINSLIDAYAKEHDDDVIVPRDAEIVMTRYPHLFCPVSDGGWAAATSIDSRHASSGQVGWIRSDRTAAKPPADTDESIAATLYRVFAEQGPRTLGQLTASASSFLPARRSAKSIGPILLNRKDLFERLLPGLFYIRGALDLHEPKALASVRSAFTERQVAFYAQARFGGERFGMYPMWLPEMEALWLEWARYDAGPEIFESLLYVVAEARAAGCGEATSNDEPEFTLRIEVSEGAMELPTLDRILAGCLHARTTGSISTASANRVMFRRLDSTSAAPLLAVLVALDAVSTTEPNWQREHTPCSSLGQLTQRLSSELVQKGHLSWDSELGRSLLDRVAVWSPGRNDWLSRDLQSALLGSRSGEQERTSDPVESLEGLLRQAADQSSQDQAAQVLARLQLRQLSEE